MNTSNPSHTPPTGSQPPSSSLKETARDAATKAGSVARDTAAKVAASTADYANEKKTAAADRVEAYGRAVDETAKSLEHEDPNIAWFTHRAAERLEGVANYVRNGDLRTLRADAENLAGRHPAVFFGGMCVAGLLLGSVLKASRAKAGDGLSSNETGGAEDTFTPEATAAGI